MYTTGSLVSLKICFQTNYINDHFINRNRTQFKEAVKPNDCNANIMNPSVIININLPGRFKSSVANSS